MPATIKRTLVWLFWIFLIYAIIASPDNAAEILRAIWRTIVAVFSSILRFFQQLTGSP